MLLLVLFISLQSDSSGSSSDGSESETESSLSISEGDDFNNPLSKLKANLHHHRELGPADMELGSDGVSRSKGRGRKKRSWKKSAKGRHLSKDSEKRPERRVQTIEGLLCKLM